MKKKMGLAVVLGALLVSLTGCTATEQAIQKLKEDQTAAKLDTPTTAVKMDWSFVMELRGQAEKMFMEGFPTAVIVDSSVATKDGKRVIVTLTYDMNNRRGTYGFDYEKNAQGEYTLTRYGDGVSSDNL